MSALVLRVDSLDDARRAIDIYSQAGFPGRAALVQAVIDGRIAHQEMQRTGSLGHLKRFLALAARRPTLVLIGDDDDGPTGPVGWPCTQRLLRWARVVVLDATGAERWHYDVTINTAERFGRVLMVETSSAMLPAWTGATRRWAQHAAVQVLKVPDGKQPHPVPAAREMTQ